MCVYRYYRLAGNATYIRTHCTCMCAQQVLCLHRASDRLSFLLSPPSAPPPPLGPAPAFSLFKAPTGLLTYDTSAAATLIVGVHSSLEPMRSHFKEGWPRMWFRARDLPEGLSIDESSGVIQGAPVAATQCQVTVTAFNSKGDISTTLSFRIVVERAPASLSYDEHAASQLIVGVETQLAPMPGICV